ncbi:MAG: hypothetical protein K2Y37_11130 [Pirellulales bacterium]|nr:hypothetical protein [Pirellulales bacterium]
MNAATIALGIALLGAAGNSQSSVDIAKGIAAGQARLLKAPGGLGIEYDIRVEQAANGPIAFQNAKGAIRIKWPKLYSRFETTFRSGRRTVREATYDFEKKHSVALNSKRSAVISPFRSAWTANYLYPLRLCYFQQADQYYFEGAQEKSDVWLPAAIERNPYEVRQTDAIDGAACQLLERPGIDSLWIAPGFGYMVLKREITFGAGQPLRERTTNRQFRQVVPGGWLPATQQQEHFDLKSGRATHTFHVEIQNITVGSVSDESLVVVIPDGVQEIHDQFRNVMARNPRGDRPFTSALAESRLELTGQRVAIWRSVRNWSIVAALLGVVVIVLARRQARQRAA